MFNNICLTIRRLSHILEQYTSGVVTHVNSKQSAGRLQPVLPYFPGLTTKKSCGIVCPRALGCGCGRGWVSRGREGGRAQDG